MGNYSKTCRKAVSILKTPSNILLQPTYQKMLDQMHRILDEDDLRLCLRTLGTNIDFQTPMHLSDVATFVTCWEGVIVDEDSVREMVQLCGSFLALRGKVVVFVHPSAETWLMTVDDMYSYRTGANKHH